MGFLQVVAVPAGCVGWCDIVWFFLNVILTLDLLLSLFVTVGTRLERTQLSLCGSNTELIHRPLPSQKFHMASRRRSPCFFFPFFTLLFVCYYAVVLTYVNTLWNQLRHFPGLLQDVYWCAAASSRLFKVELCNYKPIIPVWYHWFFLFPLSWHLFPPILLGRIVSCGSWGGLAGLSSTVMVHNINGNRSPS